MANLTITVDDELCAHCRSPQIMYAAIIDKKKDNPWNLPTDKWISLCQKCYEVYFPQRKPS